MSDIPIHIPSYNRAGIATTPALMRSLGFSKITVWVRESEWHKYVGTAVSQFCDIRSVNDDRINTLANTRQYLLDKINDDFYVVMDDDIRRFSHKKDPKVFGGLRPARRSSVVKVFEHMRATSYVNNGWFVGSVPDRYTVARPSNETYKKYGFMRQCLFMGRKLRGHVRFDRLKVFLDIDYSLQAMKVGVPMQIARNLCVETPPDAYSAKKGGFGAEREKMLAKAGDTQEVYDKRAWAALWKLHPDVIKLQEATGKHRIDWKGAYEMGLDRS